MIAASLSFSEVAIAQGSASQVSRPSVTRMIALVTVSEAAGKSAAARSSESPIGVHPTGCVVGDLLAQGFLVDAVDRHRQLGRLAALGPAGLGVVAFVSEDAEADVELRPIVRDGVDHLVEHALGGVDPRLAGVGLCRHRAGGVHDQLDVDLRPRFRLGEGLLRSLDGEARPAEASNIPRIIIRVIHVWARVVTAFTFSLDRQACIACPGRPGTQVASF